MDFRKYKSYPQVDLSDRKWPEKIIKKAPIWCSVDLRDGNQALNIPMSVEKKLEMFKMLVEIGFKEIEIGFPSASDTEFSFARTLIENNLIPEDVKIQVLVQAREHLIKRTFEALKGTKQAIIHLYNSTSKVQREVVFRKDKKEIIDIAIQGTEFIKKYKQEYPETDFQLEYSPESFTGTELDYALEISQIVLDTWGEENGKVIINLPATVEMSTPNVYADRIEWFCRNLKKRDSAIISLHTHNDRGTAVAAAELGVLAGADRIEGSLLGNGERSGNMDIITMALNLYTQGVNPELDFSELDRITDVYNRCTGMDIYPRHPYVGELVYTAFSGSHQDAINKGMKFRQDQTQNEWEVPYLPIDPKDVGRTYESIIRINSQSGKGGVAYIMETEFNYQIPKWMQPYFSRVVQKVTDETGRELNSSEIFGLFNKTYLSKFEPYKLNPKYEVSTEEKEDQTLTVLKTTYLKNNEIVDLVSTGNGSVDAFVKGFRKNEKLEFKLDKYFEHAISFGSDSKAAAYVKLDLPNGKSYCGVGIDSNISVATNKAIISAVNLFA